jgi:hypothetical protein
MKNLMIYLSTNKDFDTEGKTAVKIQIDNSLDLGWNPDDMMLITNFDYEYNGIKAHVIRDLYHCHFYGQVSKINAINYLLLEPGLAQNDIYWFHDLDAYQCEPFTKFKMKKKTDIAIAKYGRRQLPNTGSFFFKTTSVDIFKKIRKICYAHRVDEEVAMTWLPQEMLDRIEYINPTYNYTSFNHYEKITKPLKVAHFHYTYGTDILPVNTRNPKPNQMDFFLKGINKYGKQIVPERLVNIFKEHNVL